MDINKVSQQLEEATQTFAELGEARRKLVGQELTHDLFEEINGSERGLEVLLGREISVLDFGDVGKTAKLKQDIFDAIMNEEIEAGKAIHAALECYCEDLVRICSEYDAYSEENLALRTKLIEKMKSLPKESKESLADLKLDFECFSYTNGLEICKLTQELIEFFETDTCNLAKLEELQGKQGIDMTDEDKEFLKTLQTVIKQNLSEPGWKKFDVLWGDRLTGAKFGDLGFDAKNIVELCKTLNKTQEKFMKMIRKIRESLVKETATTDAVAIKNTEFYGTINRLIWYTQDIARFNKELDQQLALTSKACDVIQVEKKKDDLGNPNPDDKNNPDNNEPESQE